MSMSFVSLFARALKRVFERIDFLNLGRTTDVREKSRLLPLEFLLLVLPPNVVDHLLCRVASGGTPPLNRWPTTPPPPPTVAARVTAPPFSRPSTANAHQQPYAAANVRSSAVRAIAAVRVGVVIACPRLRDE